MEPSTLNLFTEILEFVAGNSGCDIPKVVDHFVTQGVPELEVRETVAELAGNGELEIDWTWKLSVGKTNRPLSAALTAA